MRLRSWPALVALVVSLSLVAAACDDSSTPAPKAGPVVPSKLTFGVYGEPMEISAYQRAADAYNARNDESKVSLRTWPDEQSLVKAVREGTKVPDVFLVSRRDLAGLETAALIKPVDTYLDERGVRVGDDYSREALEAFSSERHLQCMPFGVSPMVIFYNTALVDFNKMRARELPAPRDDEHKGWNLEQFAAAAQFASRPGRDARGVYVDPTLRGLAPFVYSGGGRLFDDTQNPTTLTFSDDATRSALQRTLEVLRNPRLTLSEGQLARQPALDWFEQGRLGMIAGFRSLVPELRTIPGLDFDVMPMPVLDATRTVGDISGICLSAAGTDLPEAADFLVHMISAESVSTVTRAGYLVPANQQVAFSNAFDQPGLEPAHGPVFTNAIRSIQVSPLLESEAALENAVATSLDELVNGGPVIDLNAVTDQIDQESQPVLDPASVIGPSDGTSPSSSSTPDPSPTLSETPSP